MNLLCVSWEAVGQSGKALLSDIMQTKGVLTSYDVDFEVAGDYIDTWDMTKGTWGVKYFYADRPEWNDPSAPEIDYTDCWIADDGEGNWVPVNPELLPGASFWLNHKGADIPALNFTGQVFTETGSYTLVGGQMNLCGNPYPTVLDLNTKAGQVVIVGATSYDVDFEVPGDYIDTWNFEVGSWGAKYFYADRPEWNDPSAPEIDYTDCWIADDGEGNWIPTPTQIPVGSGFWYNAKANATLTFLGIGK